MKKMMLAAAMAALSTPSFAQDGLRESVARDYRDNLSALFDHFHRNPELSGREVQTSARMAQELRTLGYEVTSGVGGTGVVAIMRNGAGPTWTGCRWKSVPACRTLPACARPTRPGTSNRSCMPAAMMCTSPPWSAPRGR
jgi:hypothetical protein